MIPQTMAQSEYGSHGHSLIPTDRNHRHLHLYHWTTTWALGFTKEWRDGETGLELHRKNSTCFFLWSPDDEMVVPFSPPPNPPLRKLNPDSQHKPFIFTHILHIIYKLSRRFVHSAHYGLSSIVWYWFHTYWIGAGSVSSGNQLFIKINQLVFSGLMAMREVSHLALALPSFRNERDLGFCWLLSNTFKMRPT